MLIRNKTTGHYLALAKDFRPGMTAQERVAGNGSKGEAPGLASTTRESLPKVAELCGFDLSEVELVPFDAPAF